MDNRDIVVDYVESFILKHKTDFTVAYDIGCVGSSYTLFYKQNVDVLYGIDILNHNAEHAKLCQHIQKDFREITRLEPRAHIITCINSFAQMASQYERSHNAMVQTFHKFVRLALDGVLVTVPFNSRGRNKDRVYLTPVILRQMVMDYPYAWRSVKFYNKGKQIPYQTASLLGETSLAIIEIDKLASIT